MKKVLIIINTDFVSCGGLTSVAMNYYLFMDKTGLQIDFASSNDNVEESLLNTLSKNNSRYFSLGSRRGHAFRYYRNLSKLLKREKYDVVHINGNSSIMAIDLAVCWFRRVKTRIAHGHTSSSDFPLVHKLLKPFMNVFATTSIAVSHKTGKWLYGKKYIILNNAIDIDKYSYSKDVDLAYRKEFGLEDAFVIGNVGKLMKAKNHGFLMDVFAKYIETNKKARLVIVGGGELEQPLKEKRHQLGLDNEILFLGMRNDVEKVINMFDIFVFPSVYEGFGMSLVEAQANGLNCIASNNVPKETGVTDHAVYIENNNIEVWLDELEKYQPYDRKKQSIESRDVISDKGFNIRVEADKLRKIYLGDNKE